MLEKIKEEAEEYIYLNEKFKNAYFWETPGKKERRREIEADNYIEFEINNRYISLYLNFYLHVSCSYFYVYKKVIINNKKTNLRAVRQVLKEIELLKNFIENYKESRFYK